MIGFIKGKAVAAYDGGVLIENHGIGYQVSVSDTSPVLMKVGTGEETIVYTVMAVREDSIHLYGFATKPELSMFQLLTGVNGVGAKAALAILSVLSAEQVGKAVLFDDAASIARAQGVGKKIAQRIVLELKDKIGDLSGLSDLAREVRETAGEEGASPDARAEALEALVALGYSRAEAAEAMLSVKDELDSAEAYIKAALHNWSR